MDPALQKRGVQRLLTAFGLVNLAEWALVMAVAVYAYRSSGPLAVGFIGFRLVPGAIMSVFSAGSDRPEISARILTGVATIRTGLALAIAGAVAAGLPVAVLIVLVCLDSVAAAPYRPAQSSLIPYLAHEPADLSAAASGASTVKASAQALGAVLGAVLVGLISVPAIPLGAAAAFALAALATMGLRRYTTSYNRPTVRTRMHLGELPAIARHPDAVYQLILSGLRTLLRGQWLALAVIVAAEVAGFGRAGLGLLTGAAGAATLLSVSWSVSLMRRARLAGPCALAFGISGVAIMSAAIHLSPGWIVLCVAVWGVGMAIADSTSTSLLHRTLNARLLARTVGLLEAIKLALEGLGALTVPVLLHFFGLRGALIAVGLPLPAAAITLWPLITRSDVDGRHRQKLIGLVRGAPSFRRLPIPAIESVVTALEPLEIGDGEVIIRQDEIGDLVYFIESGRAAVIIDGHQVRMLEAGEVFGDRGVLRGEPRSATVQADGPVHLWSLAAMDFLLVLGGGPVEAEPIANRDPVEILRGVPLLSRADETALSLLAAQSSKHTIEPATEVITEGDQSDAMFVLLEGELEAAQGGRTLRRLIPGDTFGEIGVLERTNRTASVRTTDRPAVVLRIPASTVLNLAART